MITDLDLLLDELEDRVYVVVTTVITVDNTLKITSQSNRLTAEEAYQKQITTQPNYKIGEICYMAHYSTLDIPADTVWSQIAKMCLLGNSKP